MIAICIGDRHVIRKLFDKMLYNHMYALNANQWNANNAYDIKSLSYPLIMQRATHKQSMT